MSCNICLTDIIHGCDDLEALKLILDATKDRISILSPVPPKPTPAEENFEKMLASQKARCQKTIDEGVKNGYRIYISVNNKQLIEPLMEKYRGEGYNPVKANSEGFHLDFKF